MNNLLEQLHLISLGTINGNGQIWLMYIGFQMGRNIHANTSIYQCLPQRSCRSFQQSLLQKLQGIYQLMVPSLSHNQIIAQEGLALGAFLLPNRIGGLNFLQMTKTLLERNVGIHLHHIKMAKIFIVNKSQLFLNIHITIKINIAIGRSIIFLVKINKLLIGKIRNSCWIATGFTGIGIIWEQCLHHLNFQQILWRGQGPLHFIIDYTAITQWLLWLLDFVVPALLHKNLWLIVNSWIEYRIQIYIH